MSNVCTSQALRSCCVGWVAVRSRWQEPSYRAKFCGEVIVSHIGRFGVLIADTGRYDPGLDQWSSVVPMTCCRSGVGLAVVNSKLYAGIEL